MLGKHDDWSMLWEDIASYFSPNACGTCPHIMHCYAIPSPSLRDAFLHFLRGYLIYILYARRSYANFILALLTEKPHFPVDGRLFLSLSFTPLPTLQCTSLSPSWTWLPLCGEMQGCTLPPAADAAACCCCQPPANPCIRTPPFWLFPFGLPMFQPPPFDCLNYSNLDQPCLEYPLLPLNYPTTPIWRSPVWTT